MELTAELFEELFFSVRSQAGESKDARHAPRVGLSASVVMQRLTFGNSKAKVRELRSDSLCLVVPRPLPICERVMIDLPRIGGGSLTLICEATACEEIFGGIYHLAVRLVNADEIKRPVKTKAYRA